MAEVRVKGLNECLSALRKLGADMDELKDANKELSTEIADKASAQAPVRTGRLASSVRGTRQQKRVRIKAGGARVPYAGVIEYGWPARGIVAQPFLRRTSFENKDYIKETYEENIQSLIKKYDFDPI